MASRTLLMLRTNLLSLLVVVCLLPAVDAEAKPDTPEENTAALAEVQTKAAQGFVKQELELAADYFVGKGVPKDLAQSAYWFRKAADQGNPAAQVYLGYMYTVGMGVSRDTTQAIGWYRRAASSSYPEAKVCLAVLYMRGEGVNQDAQEALRLLKSAAEKGDGRADAYLGYASLKGLGVPVNLAAAETWFRIGVKHHDPEAEFWLTIAQAGEPGRVPDLANEIKLLRLSAADGYVPAIHRLGLELVNHPDLPQAPQEATSLLLSAAKAGTWQSSALLGVLARDGQLVSRDPRAAYRWFRIAILQGGSPAEKFLHLELQRLAAGIPDAGSVDQEAAVWTQTYPNHDLFVFTNELNAKYFPLEDTYDNRARSPIDQGG